MKIFETTDKIFKSVSDVFQIDIDKILSKSQKREVVDARKAIVYFLRKYIRMTYPDISKEIKRHESVVKYLLKQCGYLMQTNIQFKIKIARVESDNGLNINICPCCGSNFENKKHKP